jgi:hypothetical protein
MPPSELCAPLALAAKTICLPDRTQEAACGGDLQSGGIGQAERDRSGGVPKFGAAAHCRSPHQPDRRAAAVESVSGHATGGGGGMTLEGPQKDRAHNLRIVGTFSNDTDDRDWEPVESKLLAAAAYVVPRRILYLRFHNGEVIATSPSPTINITSSSRPNPKAATSLVTSEIASPSKNSLANKRLPWSDQDGVCLTLTVFRSKQDFLITQQAPRINDSKRLRNPS